MVDSLYRALQPITGISPCDEDFEACGTLRWCRILFDYFVSKGHKPAVIEAQDFIYSTKPAMDQLCRTLGIDANGWKDTWDPIPREHWPDHKVGNAMVGSSTYH